MKIISTGLLVLIGLALAHGSSSVKIKWIYFRGPEDAKAEDLEKAAKALEKRCTAYGYKGINTKVSKRKPFGEKDEVTVIAANCETGFTDVMLTRMGEISCLSGTSITFHREVVLEGAEREQFGRPGGPAPKGTKWITERLDTDGIIEKVRDSDSILVSEKPLFEISDLSSLKPEGKDAYSSYYELSAKATSSLKAQTPKTVVILVEGVRPPKYIFPRGSFEWDPKSKKRARWYTGSASEVKLKLFEAILKNPMPFRLTRYRK